MKLLDQELQSYAEAHSSQENEMLAHIHRETYAKAMMPRMLSGPLQGSLLAMFVHMLRPQYILEIGTFTGYSAVWMAQALPETGKLYTLDINEELEERVRDYFAKAGLAGKIDYRIGNALDIIPGLEVTFDLVFIDADKINYRRYYDLVFDKVRKNGFIIADNVLWSGKVLQKTEESDKQTQAMINFNQYIHNDTRVENVLLPIRDGLMIARKL